MPLTDAQRTIVADNERLIWYYLRLHKLPPDEFYSVCAIGLCIAAERYEPEQGEFSTCAMYWMRGCVTRVYKHENRQKRRGSAISMSTPLGEEADSDTIESLLTDGEDVTAVPVWMDLIDRLETKRRRVAELLMRGLSQVEIARELGVTRQRVQTLVSDIRKDMASGEPGEYIVGRKKGAKTCRSCREAILASRCGT